MAKKVTKKVKTKRKVNPLYVVTNDGKDVEAASNYIELLFKKLGLDFVYEMMAEYLKGLLELVNSYPMLVEINKIIEQVVDAMELAYIRFSKSFSLF